MTREEKEKAIKCLEWFKEYNEEEYCGGDRIKDEYGDWFYRVTEQDFEIFDMIIGWLEQEPKTDRLYSWLNDMRLGIAPDETVTDIDERNVRTAQVDLLDEIMEWMFEPQESEDKE